ncbi:type II toxin-antitoxin system RelE/ParE family toxin [Persephonella sp. KM09-Lau-8]|uniref:type II toxin-antitoxin system RelE family toxin n=1 Tax=Persephonella sp. KM09-Lau-8 TaxID=1158345 RepID=UPI0004953B7F|nr:type II toxin-antitoxin system RelE/ParE family toxin [Persephonella sp. KM09-Lau-8]
MYEIKFTKTALKELNSLNKPIQELIIKKLEILSQNPNLLKNNIKVLKGKCKGLKRLRVGKYRVIFDQKDDELIILIIRVASRGEIY